VACAAHGDSIEVWDLSSSRQIAAFTTTANVECMDFSADGRLLACGTDAATVEVFDVVEQRRIVDTRCFGDGIVSAVAFSPNGNVLACGGSRGVTVLVDPQSGTTLGKLRMWGAWEISSISFSADGKQLATGNLRGHVAIWRLDGRRVETNWELCPITDEQEVGSDVGLERLRGVLGISRLPHRRPLVRDIGTHGDYECPDVRADSTVSIGASSGRLRSRGRREWGGSSEVL